MDNQIKKRKYKIGSLLNLYSEDSQRILIENLLKDLKIGKNMFSLYVNATIDNPNAPSMNDKKLKIIGEFFNVDWSTLVVNEEKETFV